MLANFLSALGLLISDDAPKRLCTLFSLEKIWFFGDCQKSNIFLWLLVIVVILVSILTFLKRKRGKISMTTKSESELKVGKFSTVFGDVKGQIGDFSTVVGPTDSSGNTIINGQMAIGYGAKAGPNSISIGAFSGSGVSQQKIEDK